MKSIANKSSLVRELGLSQTVVEKRTTIPMLSNCETATDFLSELSEVTCGASSAAKENGIIYADPLPASLNSGGAAWTPEVET